MKSIIKYILSLLVLAVAAMGAHYHTNTERPLAFVQKFKPTVGVEKDGKVNPIQKRGKPLYNGDTLRTSQDGFALVQFMDKSLAKVRPDSRLIVRGKVEDKNNTSTRIGLELGEIFLNVSEQGGDNFEVATNTSVASVKGTEFGASADDYFWVKEGEVEVRVKNTGNTVTLTNQTYAQVQEDGTVETGDLTDDEINRRDQKYKEMDEKMEPEIYKLRFIDENGQEQVIEVKVFENDN
ncbi:MAG: FecR family protein [Fodinibius sp.]|nr:FecR family protein [Fodinibius sp.]